MKIGLKVQDIVLIGLFNSSKFDRYTFIKNNIFKEDEILNSSIFLPDFVRIETSKCNLIINQNQLILSSKDILSNELSVILSSILNIGDELNLKASGLNFRYFIEQPFNNEELDKFINQYFYNPNNPIQMDFNDNRDASFGFYSSKDFENLRLKLDVKPVTIDSGNDNNRNIQFEFNFHKDYNISENSILELKEIIANYNIYKSESERIINKLS
ncbi:hypothetical protein RCH33_559 [Flavobacterium daejeonense]|nr:hypothetical protein RCH33_559 [Flavobacterium daejeonense]